MVIKAGDPGMPAWANSVDAAMAQRVTKGSLMVNAKDYGATGNGVADDTTALTAAATAAAGGTLLIPSGTYLVTGPVLIPDNTTVVGRGATLKSGGYNYAMRLSSGCSVERVEFAGTLADGAVGLSLGQGGIVAEGVSGAYLSDINIRGCRFVGMHDRGINFRFVESFNITECEFTRCAYAGALLANVSRGFVGHNVINGNGNQLPTFASNSYGITVTCGSPQPEAGTATNPVSEDVTVAFNVVRDQAWAALDSHVGKRIKFIGNTIENCKASGIAVLYIETDLDLAPQEITVTGNTIAYPTDDEPSTLIGPAILLRGSVFGGSGRQRVTGVIANNVIRRMGRQDSSVMGAIYVTDGQGVAVTGNTLYRPRSYGVYLSDVSGAMVSGNIIEDVWKSSGAPGAFFLVAVTDTGLDVTLSGNTIRRGDMVAGAVNASAVSGTTTAGAILLSESGNNWNGVPSNGNLAYWRPIGQSNREIDGLAAPTTGAWTRGDRVRNLRPDTVAFAGWICTIPGTPGTWKSYGPVTP